MDEALSNLGWLEVSQATAGEGLELADLEAPFKPKPFDGSMKHRPEKLAKCLLGGKAALSLAGATGEGSSGRSCADPLGCT